MVEVRGTLEELRALFTEGFVKESKRQARKLGTVAAKKTSRKVSAYSKKYGRAFKKLQSKYKTKAGKWQKDGFKRCQKAAHALAKRMK